VDNVEMLKVTERLGFLLMKCTDGTVRARLMLTEGGASK